MANTIIPKRSSVAGKAPLTTDLQVGEVAINLADGLIFTKNAAGTVITLGGSTLTSGAITTALGYTPANKAGDTFTGSVLTSNAGGFTANSAAKLWTDSSRGRLDLYESASQTKSLRVMNANGYGIMGMTSAENLELWTNGVARLTLGGSGNVTASTNILVNNGTDSRLLLQVSGVTEGQVQSTASTIRLSSNNTLPLVLATNGVDRLTLASDGLVTFGTSTYVGLGGAPSSSARLRVVGTGLSSELARIEGGTLDASFIVNQTDDPTVNTLRAQISLRKNNVIGATISIDGSAANRGIVYYDASSATGSHAFYVNSVDRFRVNAVGAVSFSGAYGTAGQMLKSGGSAGVPTWASLTSGEVTTALGFTPGVGDVNLSGTQTLTNKRVTPRVVSIASAATITPTGDTADQYIVTALAQSATIAAPSGTPTDGQKLVLRFEDNGTAQALTWASGAGAYRAVGTTLPTTTVISKALYVGCIYNSQDGFWDVIAVAQQA